MSSPSPVIGDVCIDLHFDPAVGIQFLSMASTVLVAVGIIFLLRDSKWLVHKPIHQANCPSVSNRKYHNSKADRIVDKLQDMKIKMYNWMKARVLKQTVYGERTMQEHSKQAKYSHTDLEIHWFTLHFKEPSVEKSFNLARSFGSICIARAWSPIALGMCVISYFYTTDLEAGQIVLSAVCTLLSVWLYIFWFREVYYRIAVLITIFLLILFEIKVQNLVLNREASDDFTGAPYIFTIFNIFWFSGILKYSSSLIFGLTTVLSVLVLWITVGDACVGEVCPRTGNMHSLSWSCLTYLSCAYIAYDKEKSLRQQYRQTVYIQDMIRHIAVMDLDKILHTLETKIVDCPSDCNIRSVIHCIARFKPFIPQAVFEEIQIALQDADGANLDSCDVNSHESLKSLESPEEPTLGAPGSGSLRLDSRLRSVFAPIQCAMKPCSILTAQVPFAELLPTHCINTSSDRLIELQKRDSLLTEIVHEEAMATGGLVLQFGGGMCSVVWNAYTPNPEHERKACLCALSLRGRLAAQHISVNIAILADSCLVGFTGTNKHKSELVSSSTAVNASRILALGKKINTSILVTEEIYAKVQAEFGAVVVDCVVMEGFKDSTFIYELVDNSQLPSSLAREYRAAFGFLCTGEVQRSKASLLEVLNKSQKTEYPESGEDLSGPFAELQAHESNKNVWFREQALRLLKVVGGQERSGKGDYRPYQRKDGWRSKEGPLPLEAEELQSVTAVVDPTPTYIYDDQSSLADDRNSLVDDGELVFQQIEQSFHWRATNPPSSIARSTEPTASHERNILSSSWSQWDAQEDAQEDAYEDAQEDAYEDWTAQQQATKGMTKSVSFVLADSPADQERSLAHVGSIRSISKKGEQGHLLEITDQQGRVWFMSNKCIGSGGFGQVYLGMSSAGFLVAIKSVPVNIHKDSSSSDLHSQLNEIRLLCSFSDQHIVAYLGTCYESASCKLHVVMEYVASGSLAQLLTNFGAIPLSSARKYIRDILKGLTYLHTNAVIHRDIKPANVLVDTKGDCKLTDFGTADIYHHINKSEDNQPVESVSGTPAYMAPEVVLGNGAYPGDVWAFGVTALQVILGISYRLPVLENLTNQVQIIFAVSQIQETPTIPDSLPEEVQDFVQGCLTIDPAQRSTVHELRHHAFLV